MKTEHINFTEKALQTLPLPEKSDGVKTYYDSGSKNGLCLIVSYSGSKTFYFLCYFQDRPVRVKIGKLGHISLTDARRAAVTMREQTNKGEAPSAPAHIEAYFTPRYRIRRPHNCRIGSDTNRP